MFQKLILAGERQNKCIEIFLSSRRLFLLLHEALYCWEVGSGARVSKVSKHVRAQKAIGEGRGGGFEEYHS